ncbi:non-specific lipid transfer protein GPI-anchored 5-like [Rhododendron vialii]|uniref:non-specific lipid transfer protein GPI-anchored 5-like n=1 Tax=Rhododendron vialii TaxID=182163 RepID=UPI00265DDC13|nr:non-specific lipid transfer protein GPI-anchored 5-like [Rhododendron vialii]
MANRKIGMELVLVVAAVVVAVLWGGAAAQSSSSNSCTNVLMSMSPCLNYITGNSSEPSSSCCQQLATVVRSQPQCLCAVLNGGGSSMGINVNQTLALALPAACGVQTPPVSRCNGSSPTASPTGKSPNTVPSNSGTGSKTVPSTTESGTSDASSIRITISMLFTLLFVASYASISTVC